MYYRYDRRRWAGIMAMVLLVVQLFILVPAPESVKKSQAADPLDVSTIVTSGSGIATIGALGVPEVIVPEVTKDSIRYQWMPVPGATHYDVFLYNQQTGVYDFLEETDQTAYLIGGLLPGEACYLIVCAVNRELDVRGEYSTPHPILTRPEMLQTFTISENTANSVTLRWAAVPSATGYIIYRAGTGGNFKRIDATEFTEYTDSSLESAKVYQYKIVTYAGSEDNVGAESPAIFTCSLPAAPVVKIKGGDGRIRLNWAAIDRSEGYRVYLETENGFELFTTLEKKSNKEFLHTNLENGTSNTYYVTAYRNYNGVMYEGAMSNQVEATAQEVDDTSMEPKLFQTKAAFQKSDACKKNKDFKKKVKYAKSFPIPGMVHTNVAGFACTTMVPQGITCAKSCFFITAYDSTGVERSVIYVVDKASKELLTTIVLPNKAHAGGIAFDGKNLWITQSQTLRSIAYKVVSDAIENQEPYVEVAAYTSEVSLTQQAATVVYYKKLLWVASYDELKAGYLVSCEISDKSTQPTLTELGTIKMPTRVQGIAFTNNNCLVVSRSCQTNAKQRGFLHQLDVYQPNLKKASDGTISLGKVRKTVVMPTMNEELAVSGSLLYVNFESVSFSSAVMRMDRICPLPIKFITKLK